MIEFRLVQDGLGTYWIQQRETWCFLFLTFGKKWRYIRRSSSLSREEAETRLKWHVEHCRRRLTREYKESQIREIKREAV